MDNNFTPETTADGSYTFYSSEFQEHFHSQTGAKQEAEKKFIEPCQLAAKAQKQSQITLLDICYGLGYNTAAALETIWSINPQCQVTVIALEKDMTVPRQASQYQLLQLWPSPIPQILQQFAQELTLNISNFTGQLIMGDARQTLPLLSSQNLMVDAIFLDPFSPPKCPQLWTVEFIRLVANCLKSDGYLATYSCAASVRKALILAGLNIGSVQGMGRKAPGTVASFSADHLPPLTLIEKEHLQTRAAIPYRDPTLQATPEDILQHRRIEQASSPLESSSQWKKRWLTLYF